MTRGAHVSFVAMATATAMRPAAARAGPQCQSAPVTGIGAGTEDAAAANWCAQVKQTYGAAWSNFSLAKDPKYSEQNLARWPTCSPPPPSPPNLTVVAPAGSITKSIGPIERH